MIEKSEEMRMIEHLQRIMNNLGQYWHSIELLLGHVSKPLVVDDRGLANVLSQFRETLKETTLSIGNLDITKVLGEIKYIGNRLNTIETTIVELKEEGVKKRIHLDLTCDGYEMRKKVNPYDKMLEDQQILDPDGAVRKLLDTLAPREASVITHRLGLFGEEKKTWDKVGEVIGVTRERARQIYAKSLRKLRHPKIRNLVEDITHAKLRKEIIGD